MTTNQRPDEPRYDQSNPPLSDPTHAPQRLNRRRFVGGAVGLGGAVLLTGCGRGGDAADPTSTPADPPVAASNGGASVNLAENAPGEATPELDAERLVQAEPPDDESPEGTDAPDQVTQTETQPENEGAEEAATPDAQPEPPTELASGDGFVDGLAVVVSPRLPLTSVSADQARALLGGQISDWREVGLPFSLPVEAVTMPGAAQGTEEGYGDLVSQLNDGLKDFSNPIGRIALAPPQAVDFQVAVLAVDGVDPLRDREEGFNGRIFSVAMVGDIVPGRNVHLRMQARGDWTYPFHRISDHLNRYDLTIANLEGNLSTSLPQPVETNPNTTDFVTSPAMLDGFALAGIDGVTLGNNHTAFNNSGWGTQGLVDTILALEAVNMPFFGAGRNLEEARAPWTTTVGDQRVAFLGVDGVTANLEQPTSQDLGVVASNWGAGAGTPGTAPWVASQVNADIAAAASASEIVIPYLHMGAEFRWTVPSWVQQAARGAIDAGATMVVTNHPHIIQGQEVYNGRPIVYSLGNFIFDQMFAVDTRQGLILEVTFDGDRVVGLRNHGVEIEDFCQPRLMTPPEQAAIMDRYWRSTDRLAGR